MKNNDYLCTEDMSEEECKDYIEWSDADIILNEDLGVSID